MPAHGVSIVLWDDYALSIHQLAMDRFNCFFNSKIAFTKSVQCDSDSRKIGLQRGLRWIINPGHDVYLVFNH